jgi:hypothetical protein
MTTHEEENYYVRIKPKLMEELEKTESYFKNVLTEYFDLLKIEQLLKEARVGYEDLLPQLPYIGGEENVLTEGLIGAAWSVPLFRGLEREGLSLREKAKITYERRESDIESKSLEKKNRVREFYFSPAMRDVEMKRASESQSGKYPGDWVEEYVEGDGVTFDFGINFTECALCKFFEPRGAMKYVPIFCLGDYATYRAFGIGFRRTQTIPNGAPFCDFRFKKDWETPRGWPPEELDEKFSYQKA